MRLALLVFMAALVIRQIMGRSADPIREAHGGRDPLAGVLAADVPTGKHHRHGNGSGGKVGVIKKTTTTTAAKESNDE